MASDLDKLIGQMVTGLTNLQERVTELERLENDLPVSKNNVSNPPTAAELTTAFGSPTDLYNGFTALVNDNGAGVNVWLVVIANNDWYYEQLTLAV